MEEGSGSLAVFLPPVSTWREAERAIVQIQITLRVSALGKEVHTYRLLGDS